MPLYVLVAMKAHRINTNLVQLSPGIAERRESEGMRTIAIQVPDRQCHIGCPLARQAWSTGAYLTCKFRDARGLRAFVNGKAKPVKACREAEVSHDDL